MRHLALTVLVLGVLGCAASSAAETSIADRYGLEEAAQPVSRHAGWRKPKLILVGGMARGFDRELAAEFPGVEFASNVAASRLAEVDAVIGYCSAPLITTAPSLRWIQSMSSGVEDCTAIRAIAERNIILTNMRRVSGPVMSEHVIGLMLALTRGLDESFAAQSQRSWYAASRPRIVIKGKTLLVVGLGGIGTEVAQRAHALGMRVIATRNSSKKGPDFVAYVGLSEELPKLAAEADVIVNTAPLTPQTTGLFDAAFFTKMKRTAYFINVARGGSVVTADLTNALNKHIIAGAALDVTDPEPLPPSDPLWRAPNIIITPHVSSDSDLGFENRLEVVRENVRRYIAGDKLLSVVDLQKGY